METSRIENTRAPATRNDRASRAMAQPEPTSATRSPPMALPAMRPPFEATLTKAFAGCRCSSSTTSGTRPLIAGHHNALRQPEIAPRMASSAMVALPVRKRTAVVMTNALKMMSVTAITRARPRRSATTPPIGRTRTSGSACAARTMLSEIAVAPGSDSTPKAIAMGATPLPMLLIVRARKSLRKRALPSRARVDVGSGTTPP